MSKKKTNARSGKNTPAGAFFSRLSERLLPAEDKRNQASYGAKGDRSAAAKRSSPQRTGNKTGETGIPRAVIKEKPVKTPGESSLPKAQPDKNAISHTGKQITVTPKENSATGRQRSATGRQTSLTGKQKSYTGRQVSLTGKLPAYTARQTAYSASSLSSAPPMTAAEERKKRIDQKRTLYIVCTALAAAVILVVAFILKSMAEERSYNVYYSGALQDYYNGDYDSALTSLRRASSISETEECTMLMVDCYIKQENYDKALELLEEMYKNDKNNTLISSRIAQIREIENDKKNESIVTVAGKQYDVATGSLSIRDTGLGDGLLNDVLQLYSLSALTLSGNNLSDISPLSSLGGLVYLDLSDNKIGDISALGGLRNLKTLYLDNNPIVDFTSLYTLDRLELLSIRGIPVSDEQLRALSAALPYCIIHSESAEASASEVMLGGARFQTDVQELDLSNMGITDLTALRSCRYLRKLDITGNNISDLTPLMDLPSLEWLCFKDNVVTDLRPLMGLSSLRYINAEGNGITSTTPLASLTGLSELYLAFNPLTDISGLRSLSNLRRLGLEQTGLTDEMLPELYSMTGLDIMRIHDNPALSGEAVDALKAALRGCDVQHSTLIYSYDFGGEKFKENVTQIALVGREITDISGIIRFKSLQTLDLSNNSIENIYPFQYLPADLKALNLADNRISDTTPLMYLESLETLDLSGNNISSLSPIRLLTHLKRLDISRNPVSEEQIASLREALPECEIIY